MYNAEYNEKEGSSDKVSLEKGYAGEATAHAAGVFLSSLISTVYSAYSASLSSRHRRALPL